jgi:SPP1 family predicted phage head-tail adaptor
VTEFLPSDLRHRLALEQLERVDDGGGGFAESWATVATLQCDLRPLAGSETVEADRLAGTVTHEIALRYRPGVVPAMRFRDGTRVFHIVSVINVDERNRWLKCLCEERDL